MAIKFQRGVGWASLVIAVGLALGAVYGGFHYAVDAIAGALLGVAVVPLAGARIFSEARDIGRVTSAAFSPGREAVVGLGYVHRDFVDPGTEVTVVWNDSRSKVMIE